MLELNSDAVNASNADANGGEPIFRNGKPVGRVSSGAYGYTVGKSLAMGFVKGVALGDQVEIMVLGKPHAATILREPAFDASGSRLRN